MTAGQGGRLPWQAWGAAVAAAATCVDASLCHTTWPSIYVNELLSCHPCSMLQPAADGASIVIRTYTLQQLNSSLPWLLGSLGTVVLDFTILMQARVLGTDKKHQSDEEESLLPVISADDKPSGYAAL